LSQDCQVIYTPWCFGGDQVCIICRSSSWGCHFVRVRQGTTRGKTHIVRATGTCSNKKQHPQHNPKTIHLHLLDKHISVNKLWTCNDLPTCMPEALPLLHDWSYLVRRPSTVHFTWKRTWCYFSWIPLNKIGNLTNYVIWNHLDIQISSPHRMPWTEMTSPDALRHYACIYIRIYIYTCIYRRQCSNQHHHGVSPVMPSGLVDTKVCQV